MSWTWARNCKCGHTQGMHEITRYVPDDGRLRMLDPKRYGGCTACDCPELVYTSRRFKHLTDRQAWIWSRRVAAMAKLQ